MKHALIPSFLLALAATTSASAAPSPASLPVGHCINLGNMLEAAPTESSWGGKKLDAQDFARIKAAGFQSVRLTVSWYAHMGPAPDHSIDPAWIKRVGAMIDAALAQHLNVILDSHNFLAVHANPATGGPMLAAAWTQIAAAYRDRPDNRLWFEIENEPHDKLTNANLLATLAPSLAAIRAINPTRPVVIGGENWSGIDSLATLNLPDDTNVYPTFHYYEPFDFTHQGASWVTPTFPLGRTYGTEADKARLAADVAKLKAYVARTGRTPFMGENGAYDMMPLEQRVAYHRAVREGFAPTGIGICAWAYTNTFPFWDRKAKRWLPNLNEAFGLPSARRGRK